MIKKYSHILLTLIVLALLFACDDSLGTDPEYKETIIEKDTFLIFEIDTFMLTDTVIQIDTVLSSDSTEYIFTINSLITVRDSLGNIIDSLTQHIVDIETIDVAPKFVLNVDSILTYITYDIKDTLYDENQNPFFRTIEKFATYQPYQEPSLGYKVELDTNLGKNKAWLDMQFDGKFFDRDTSDGQQVFVGMSDIFLDNVLIYNSYQLDENASTGDKKHHITTIYSMDENDITSQTQKEVSVSFADYRFDNEDKLRGFTVRLNYLLNASVVQLLNKVSRYEIIIKLSFP